jgi:allantoinase
LSAAFAVKSQRVICPDGVRPAVVQVEHGRIRGIGPDAPAGVAVEDRGDEVIFAALTDTHVHINEPGRTEWEGFATATRAAAAGGVTMLVDMPLNSDPVTTSEAALQAKLAHAEGKLWVDCGFWGGVVPGNAAELGPMVRAGALGFKCFTCFSGIDEFPASTAEDLRIAMPILRDLGVPLLVHAELESELRLAPSDPSPRLYSNYLHSRPKEWEDAAVAMIIGLVRETGCRAHIVHLSSANALDLLRRAKAEGLPISAETCPHYLGLAAEEIPDGATEFKCAPPIRERENQERLWAGVLDGTIDFVVTDHSPCVPALKNFETGDFSSAWGGIAALQLGLRSVWTEAHRRGIPLAQVIHWMSRGTALFAGQPQRGQLVPGAPADLVALEPDAERTVEPSELLHRHPTTPWAGRRLRGIVRKTWLRGEVVAIDGRVDGAPLGRILRGGHS